MSARRTTTAFPLVRHGCNGTQRDVWFPKHVTPLDGLQIRCPHCRVVFIFAVPPHVPPLPVLPEVPL